MRRTWRRLRRSFRRLPGGCERGAAFARNARTRRNVGLSDQPSQHIHHRYVAQPNLANAKLKSTNGRRLFFCWLDFALLPAHLDLALQKTRHPGRPASPPGTTASEPSASITAPAATANSATISEPVEGTSPIPVGRAAEAHRPPVPGDRANPTIPNSPARRSRTSQSPWSPQLHG